MAAVAEDPSLVKWLLEIGADFHRRCYGNFFTCDDQKSSRRDNKAYEENDLVLETNYAGYVAWGEYPFAFAACLEQEECYRLMLSKGANHDLKDTNGNTVAHVLVVFDLMRMWDMVVECGAAINIENKAGLTPLTLAAYLARMDMFFHICSVEREIYWQLGNVTCSAYPLEYLDTIHSETGELQQKSALNLIVFGPLLEHLDLIEYVIVDLLQAKWNSFIRKSFFRQFFAFFVYFCISTVAFTLRPTQTFMGPCPANTTNGTLETNITFASLFNTTLEATNLSTLKSMVSSTTSGSTIQTFSTQENSTELDVEELIELGELEWNNRSDFSALLDLSNSSLISLRSNLTNSTEGQLCKIPEDQLETCYLLKYETIQEQIRIGAEILLVVWSFIYLVIAIRERMFLGKQIFKENMILCPSRVLFLAACFMVLVSVPLRLFCICGLEDSLAIAIMTCTGPYFLFFCRGFKLVGPMVIMVYRMLAQDIVRFGSVFFIFVMGFSQAYYIVFQSYKNSEEPHPMPNAVESILAVFLMSLGDTGFIWDGVPFTSHEYIGKIHFFIFIMIVVILLLNLLIAMMGDTYAKIAEIKNEWMRQWARTVLIVERGIPPAERLRQQDLYSERNSDGKKCLVMKQFLSKEKLEEIEEIIEMKITHRKNIDRRRERFGYESVSKMGIDVAGAAVFQEDGDEENPFGDEVGKNVTSFKDVAPSAASTSMKAAKVPLFN
ncbi:transient receptor potential cation channel subfamily V member 6 [Eurytemora carolleeae]|uniref:transient receptor potential cation channel subfamily V member 6 n=1 Tax=Eurytemora carolleeae TaxID=1294199 RepID=UPI000C76CAF7|nr:transient receptor potential cation channel subfamily V member 6 [Eurytemora carolleeae]|eukprot:XP_023334395.1 transient receptor potential cation channel subfamily V member 6-like [Eurytemora affinis]